MKSYLDIVKYTMEGTKTSNRTGVDTYNQFGYMFKHDMRDGFPLMTHKRMSLKSVAAELVWFCSGSTDNNLLHELGATIWDEWDKGDGDLGAIYGRQWRSYSNPQPFNHLEPNVLFCDQLSRILCSLVIEPNSRRHLVNAWNANFTSPDKASLPPCHFAFQFYQVDGKLSLMWYQRSCDVMLGLPYNIASYAILLAIFGIATGLTPHMLLASIGSLHIYNNHILCGAVDKALQAETHQLPNLDLSYEYFKPLCDELGLDTEIKCSKYLNRIFITQAKETVEMITGALKGYVCSPSIRMDVVA